MYYKIHILLLQYSAWSIFQDVYNQTTHRRWSNISSLVSSQSIARHKTIYWLGTCLEHSARTREYLHLYHLLESELDLTIPGQCTQTLRQSGAIPRSAMGRYIRQCGDNSIKTAHHLVLHAWVQEDSSCTSTRPPDGLGEGASLWIWEFDFLTRVTVFRWSRNLVDPIKQTNMRGLMAERLRAFDLRTEGYRFILFFSIYF
jgi:hypothetical protein